MAESNVADYFFESSAVGAGSLRVVSFVGEEWINRPYRFTISLQGEDPDLDLASLLDKPAGFTIHAPGGTGLDSRTYHGVIVSAALLNRDAQRVSFEVELVPRLWLLGLRRNSRIFQDMDIPTAIQLVLEEAGFTSDDFKFDLSASYPKRAYITQYDESELDFIHRLLESQGIAYTFGQKDDFEAMAISDGGRIADAPIQPVSSILFRFGAGLAPEGEQTISQFATEQKVITSKVALKDFTFKSPTDSLLCEHEGDGPVKYEDYRYPGGYFTADHGDQLAESGMQRHEVRRQTMRGAGDCRSFAAGYQFTLKDHFVDALNQDYTLIHVRHQGADSSLSGHEGAKRYQNNFDCIPADIVYRPPTRTPRPVVAGFQTAVCTGPAGEKLFMDDLGRTKVKFHWDRSDTREDHTSAFLRVSQPYAGPRHGIQFNPLVGDEVIVQFENGDPDRPLITGRVYNSDKMPPLKPANRIQNVIYTPYQHKLLFDDKQASITLTTGGSETLSMVDGAQGNGNNIRLSTADGHFMHLREDGPAGIEIKTKEANYTLYDDTNDIIETKTTGGHSVRLTDTTEPGVYTDTIGKHRWWLSDSQKTCGTASTNGHQISIDDNNNSINLALTGGHIVQLAGDAGFVAINSKNKHVITIDDNTAAITLQDASGNHTIQIHESGGTIHITATTGDILIDAKAGKLDLHGKEVSISADTKVTIQGMDVESKATMTHTITGNAVSSTASAINTVKGGIVQLNP